MATDAHPSETVLLLRSIDQSLRSLVVIAQQKAEARVKNQQTSTKTPPRGSENIADDKELDGKYGDPEIKAADPRDWTGETMKGRRMSQCPAPYLEMLADRFEYFADKAEAEDKRTASGKLVAPYNRKDAARARGWAARLRAGWKPSEMGESGDHDDDQMPDGWAR